MYTITTIMTGCTPHEKNESTIEANKYSMLIFYAKDGYEFKEPYSSCISVMGATLNIPPDGCDPNCIVITIGKPTSDVTITVTAKSTSVTEYQISTNLTGCVARSNNASTIETDSSTMLKFDAQEGYEFSKPYSSCVNVTGATLEISDISTAACLAIIIFNPTSNVTVNVTATKTGDDGSYSITINTVGCTSASGNATSIMPDGNTWLYFTANDGYYFKEPYMDCYTVTGAQAGWNMDTGSLGLWINTVTGDVIVTVVATKNADSYSIQVTVSGCEASPSNPTSIAPDGVAELTFTPSMGYLFADDVSVTGAQYVWSKANGQLVIYNPTSDVSIKITAVLKEYSITVKLTGCTGAEDNLTAIKHGEGCILYFTVNEGYTFPEAVEVIGATQRWFPDSGRLWIMEPVSDITVTIVATKGGSDTVWYNQNGSWIKCYIYYYDGTKWVKCRTYYNNNGTWVKI